MPFPTASRPPVAARNLTGEEGEVGAVACLASVAALLAWMLLLLQRQSECVMKMVPLLRERAPWTSILPISSPAALWRMPP